MYFNIKVHNKFIFGRVSKSIQHQHTKWLPNETSRLEIITISFCHCVSIILFTFFSVKSSTCRCSIIILYIIGIPEITQEGSDYKI